MTNVASPPTRSVAGPKINLPPHVAIVATASSFGMLLPPTNAASAPIAFKQTGIVVMDRMMDM